jgi:hypothetical protein
MAVGRCRKEAPALSPGDTAFFRYFPGAGSRQRVQIPQRTSQAQSRRPGKVWVAAAPRAPQTRAGRRLPAEDAFLALHPFLQLLALSWKLGASGIPESRLASSRRLGSTRRDR